MKALFSKLNDSATQDVSRRKTKENEQQTNEFRRALSKGEIEEEL